MIGCDGTFNVFTEYLKDDVRNELNTIVSRDELTGKTYEIIILLCSRKTTAIRNVIFRYLIQEMRKFGLQDPCFVNARESLSLTIDFKTSYALALGEILAEEFKSTQPLSQIANFYVKCLAFGCDVHAKRTIRENVNNSEYSSLYQWAVGTRRLEDIIDIQRCLVMKEYGEKWSNFSNWLLSNKIAFIICFQEHHKSMIWSTNSRFVMMDTNYNESKNNRLKASAEF